MAIAGLIDALKLSIYVVLGVKHACICWGFHSRYASRKLGHALDKDLFKKVLRAVVQLLVDPFTAPHELSQATIDPLIAAELAAHRRNT
jgi:hypothetical protein